MSWKLFNSKLAPLIHHHAEFNKCLSFAIKISAPSEYTGINVYAWHKIVVCQETSNISDI